MNLASEERGVDVPLLFDCASSSTLDLGAMDLVPGCRGLLTELCVLEVGVSNDGSN